MSTTAPSNELDAPSGIVTEAMIGLGDWTVFSGRALRGIPERQFTSREFLRIAVEFGARSVGVVAVTGLFIGMVLAVQLFSQFHVIGLDTSLGAITHLSIVRELGPVLASTMLAGRIGSAIAAELATMRITEQIDALSCLGVDPVKHLVAPRFLACLVMVPLLTAVADVMGLMGSSAICIQVYGVDPHHFWRHSREFVRVWDVFVGIGKAFVFGGILSLIACHRGFHSKPGAAGVGRAATEAFVYSFVAIIITDFVLAMFSNTLHDLIWPQAIEKVA